MNENGHPPIPGGSKSHISADNNGAGTQTIAEGIDGNQNAVYDSAQQHNHHPSFSNEFKPSLTINVTGGEASGNKRTAEESTVLVDHILQQLERQPHYPTNDFSDHQKTIYKQITPGTGTWVLKTDEYRKWKDTPGSPQFLLMHGILGSGKSTLAALIIERLKAETKDNVSTTCVYLYFKQEDEQQLSEASIWATMLYQLIAACEGPGMVSSKLENKFRGQASTRIHPSDYLSLFQSQASRFTKIYLITDNFDSLSSIGEIHNDLCNLPANIKVLLTSKVDRLGPAFDYQNLYIVPQRDDIRKFIEHRLKMDAKLGRLLENHKNTQGIIHQITQSTLKSGVFLQAKRYMDKLSKVGTDAGIDRVLSEGDPSMMVDLFDASVQHILKKRESDSFDFGLARHILSWVVYAKVELSQTQLLHSFAIAQLRDHPGNRYHENIPKRLPEEVCDGLVITDLKEGTVRLVHASVPICLKGNLGIMYADTDLQIAKTCLMALLLELPEQEEPIKPLVEYASRYWVQHLACHGQADKEADTLILQLLQDDSKLERAFKATDSIDGLSGSGMTGLHATVHFDLVVWAERLLKDGVEINTQAADGQTALHWAVQYERHSLIKLFIANGAHVNLPDDRDDNPLHKALYKPWPESESLIQLLVEGSAHVEVWNSQSQSPLSLAFRDGPPSVIIMLLERQRHVNAEISDGWTSLRYVLCYETKSTDTQNSIDHTPEKPIAQESATSTRAQLLKLLLEKEVDFNCRSTRDGWTPVEEAVRGRDPALLQMMLQHGADADNEIMGSSTPLIEAVKSQDQKTVWLLLNSGASVNKVDGTGWSPLLYALNSKENSLIWLLLSWNATVKPRVGSVPSALDLALKSHDFSMAWLLFQHGLSVSAADDQQGRTPLHKASREGDIRVVKFLLHSGASLDLLDSESMSPLHLAVAHDKSEVAALLSSRMSNLETLDSNGNTILIFAILKKKTEMVQILLSHGASPNTRNAKKGMTAIHHAAWLGFDQGLRYLVRNPRCLLDSQDDHGFTAIHHSVNSDHAGRSILDILREAGASLDAGDKDGKTPLMVATQRKRLEIVKYLLEWGADVNRLAHNGWEARHFATDPQIASLLNRPW